MDGVLIVNKPIGKTSFDIVRDVRKKYNTKKVGHIGTLDPMATGVLPILVGKATKLSNHLMEHDKEYVATLLLGIQTNTGDCEGQTIKEMPVNDEIFDSTIIKNILESFIGESSQVPPMYSAIKVNGKKLYELAREGKSIEREPRKIDISQISLLNFDSVSKEITFKVTCSKGTYIRTLCEDIAKKLGNCGYMKSLERTRVGNFRIEDANRFISLEKVLVDVPKINVSDYNKLKNGMKILADNSIDKKYSGFANLYFDDRFVGIGELKNQLYKRYILIDL